MNVQSFTVTEDPPETATHMLFHDWVPDSWDCVNSLLEIVTSGAGYPLAEVTSTPPPRERSNVQFSMVTLPVKTLMEFQFVVSLVRVTPDMFRVPRLRIVHFDGSKVPPVTLDVPLSLVSRQGLSDPSLETISVPPVMSNFPSTLTAEPVLSMESIVPDLRMRCPLSFTFTPLDVIFPTSAVLSSMMVNVPSTENTY